jgi:hypothetical protein
MFLLMSAAAYWIAVLQCFMPAQLPCSLLPSFSPRGAARYVLRLLQRTRDYIIHFFLHFPLLVLGVLRVPHYMQNRIVFQPTPVFFTRGTKSTLTAICIFLVLVMSLVTYNLVQMVGVVPTATLDPWQCS